MMRVYRILILLVFSSCFFVSFVDDSLANEPCTSGLQPGQRPGPYAAVIATGPQRGQPTCYVCETGERPAVVVFARSLGDPLGRLAVELDRAVGDHKTV